MNRDEFNRLFFPLSRKPDTVADQGSIAYQFIQALGGKAALYYSPSQAASQAARLISEEAPSPTGYMTVMHIHTGKVLRFSDIEVLEGDKALIKFHLQPCQIDKEAEGTVPVIAQLEDVSALGRFDPKELLPIASPSGKQFDFVFRSRSAHEESLISMYGMGQAVQIVDLLSLLPGGAPSVYYTMVGEPLTRSVLEDFRMLSGGIPPMKKSHDDGIHPRP